MAIIIECVPSELNHFVRRIVVVFDQRTYPHQSETDPSIPQLLIHAKMSSTLLSSNINDDVVPDLEIEEDSVETIEQQFFSQTADGLSALHRKLPEIE